MTTLEEWNLSDAERQLLVAYRMTLRKQLTLDRETLIEQATLCADGKPRDLNPAFDSLVQRGWLLHESDNFSLSDVGVAVAREVDNDIGQAGFSKWFLASEKSPAYVEFCRRVYGTPFVQFNMVDQPQLDTLLEILNLDSHCRVVDLGCGIGTQAEYISDVTHAHVTGVDYARAAIQRALERTEPKRSRLDFRVGNLNALELPHGAFDVAVSFDTLYFVDDLEAVITSIVALLSPRGRFAAFYDETQRQGEPTSILDAKATRLARALTGSGCKFEWLEFTDKEQRLWTQELEVASELMPMFEAEGIQGLCQSRIDESRHWLTSHEEGRSRRYLYFAQAPEIGN